MPVNTPGNARSVRATRALVCAAAASAVLLAAGCSSGGDEEPAGAAPSASASEKAKPAKVKIAELPEPCEALSEKAVKDVVPGAQSTKGKTLPSDDTDAYGSCLWAGGSGENDGEFRSLTLSFKRYDSDTTLGSGDKQASGYYAQEIEAAATDEANSGAKKAAVSGLGGGKAESVAYETKKKDQGYTSNRVVVLVDNAVVTVDYEGTGFEDAEAPSAADVKKGAETVAKEAVAALTK